MRIKLINVGLLILLALVLPLSAHAQMRAGFLPTISGDTPKAAWSAQPYPLCLYRDFTPLDPDTRMLNPSNIQWGAAPTGEAWWDNGTSEPTTIPAYSLLTTLPVYWAYSSSVGGQGSCMFREFGTTAAGVPFTHTSGNATALPNLDIGVAYDAPSGNVTIHYRANWDYAAVNFYAVAEDRSPAAIRIGTGLLSVARGTEGDFLTNVNALGLGGGETWRFGAIGSLSTATPPTNPDQHRGLDGVPPNGYTWMPELPTAGIQLMGAPPAPQDLNLGLASTPALMQLEWSNPVAYESIDVYDNGAFVTSISGAQTSRQFENVPFGELHTYRLVGHVAANPNPSGPADAPMGSALEPAAPSNVTGTGGERQITLHITDPQGVYAGANEIQGFALSFYNQSTGVTTNTFIAERLGTFPMEAGVYQVTTRTKANNLLSDNAFVLNGVIVTDPLPSQLDPPTDLQCYQSRRYEAYDPYNWYYVTCTMRNWQGTLSPQVAAYDSIEIRQGTTLVMTLSPSNPQQSWVLTVPYQVVGPMTLTARAVKSGYQPSNNVTRQVEMWLKRPFAWYGVNHHRLDLRMLADFPNNPTYMTTILLYVNGGQAIEIPVPPGQTWVNYSHYFPNDHSGDGAVSLGLCSRVVRPDGVTVNCNVANSVSLRMGMLPADYDNNGVVNIMDAWHEVYALMGIPGNQSQCIDTMNYDNDAYAGIILPSGGFDQRFLRCDDPGQSGYTPNNEVYEDIIYGFLNQIGNIYSGGPQPQRRAPFGRGSTPPQPGHRCYAGYQRVANTYNPVGQYCSHGPFEATQNHRFDLQNY